MFRVAAAFHPDGPSGGFLDQVQADQQSHAPHQPVPVDRQPCQTERPDVVQAYTKRRDQFALVLSELPEPEEQNGNSV